MSGAKADRSEEPPAKVKDQRQSVSWNPWLAVLFVIVVYFATQLVAAVVLSLWPSIQGWSAERSSDWLSNSIYAQFFYVLITEALVVLAVYWFLRLYKSSWVQIGFRRPKLSDGAIGLAIAPLYYLVYVLIIMIAGALVPSLNVDQEQQLGFSPIGTGQLVLTFISLVILPPIVEELLMRGFLYSSLKKAMPVLGAALTTSVIFAAAHLQFGSGAPLLWVAAIDTFVLSLFLVWLREKTGSLWAGMMLHALKNGIAFVALFIFSVS